VGYIAHPVEIPRKTGSGHGISTDTTFAKELEKNKQELSQKIQPSTLDTSHPVLYVPRKPIKVDNKSFGNRKYNVSCAAVAHFKVLIIHPKIY
jgi:hypothetical protein